MATRQVVKPGERVEGPAVRFTFSNNLAELVAGTSSEPEGFRWRWFGMGSIVTSDGGPARKEDGALVLGEHGAVVHSLFMPVGSGDSLYAQLWLSELEVDVDGTAGLFKKRPRNVLLIFADGLGFSAFDIGEVMPSGRTVKKNMASTFLDSVRGRTAPPSD